MSLDITFRTLKGGTFKLSVEPSETVLDLKKKVANQQAIEEYAGIRLIYKGKILVDDATVSSAGISTTGFVVVMPPKKTVSKPAPANPSAAPAASKATPPAASTTPPTASTNDANPASTTPPTTTPASETASPTATAPSAPATTADDPNSLVTGAAYEQSVKQIVEMGFPEEEVKKALRAAFNNPQRAVDYLFNGIPESAAAAAVAPPAQQPNTPASAGGQQQPDSNPTAQTPSTTAADPRAGAPAPGTPFNMFEAPTQTTGGGAQGEGGNLAFLRALPQFNMMRRLIQANPAVLPQLLQQLEETNPPLLAIIEANRAEFTALINEQVREGEEGVDDDVMEQLAQAMAGAGGPGGGQGGPGQIYVTEEEHEQITRLSELGATIGLEQSHVVETWLACNRDETMAANFLVDHAEELRADAQRNSPDTQNPPDAPDSGDGGPPA